MNAKSSIFCLLCFLAIVPSAWCKRGAAPIIEPIICNGLEIVSPNDDGIREYVVLSNPKTEKKISEITIFTNTIQPGLEKDVQWVFIDKIQCDKGNLSITDERGRQFHLNLQTKQITKNN